MTAVSIWRRRQLREVKRKGDDLAKQADQKSARFAVQLARVALASDRVEAAAVRFIQEHENVMTVAAQARQKRGRGTP